MIVKVFSTEKASPTAVLVRLSPAQVWRGGRKRGGDACMAFYYLF